MANEADALTSVKTVLDAGWNSSNTDGVTPTVYVTMSQPMRFDHATANDHILIYSSSHTTDPNDLGASHKERTVDRVSIDIRTKYVASGETSPRLHGRRVYNEIRRIFAGKINLFDSGAFQQMIPIGYIDFSSHGFFRYVYDIYLRNWVVAR
jgi:hypothetical protein